MDMPKTMCEGRWMTKPVEAVPTPGSTRPSAEPTPSPAAPRAPDHGARLAIRIVLDVISGVALAYALAAAALSPGVVFQFWLVSLLLFPYPKLAEQLRLTRELGLSFMGVGLVLIGFTLFGGTLWPAVTGRGVVGVLQGLFITLAGVALVLASRAAPATGRSSFWLPAMAALASGCAWLWLAAR
jgi:hypothetical protein